MSYTIVCQVYQTNPNAFFRIVEKTVWQYANGGTWSEVNGTQVLTMGGSGTCGSLRFVADTGENFIVTLGVHNYKRWCDIVTDLKSGNTGVEIQPTYYQDGSVSGNRNEMLWKQLAQIEKTDSKGHKFAVNFFKEDGNTLYATITIS